MQIIKDWTINHDKNDKPVAHAKDGEVLRFITLDCFGGQIKSEDDLITSVDYTNCNPASGPVYIDGAEPGDVIAVDILKIEVDPVGFTCTLPDIGPLWDQCELRTRMIRVENGICYYNDISWPVDPMIGVIGVAPAGDPIPTGYTLHTGGNMDNPIIKAGATVYLPVEVPGALLAMGDVHATMGEGEVGGAGIEIGADILVRVRLIKNFELHWTAVETADYWYINTYGRDSDLALTRGYKEMHRLLKNAFGWDSTDIALYMSLQGRIECNQACMIGDESGNSWRIGTPKRTDKPRLIP